MNARLVIEFKDGTSKEIDLVNAVVSDHQGLQSVEFRETKPDKWILYFTERTMDGRNIAKMTFTNPTP